MTSPVERITESLAAELKRQEPTTNVWEHDGKTWASVGYDGPYMSESSGEIDIELTALAAAVLAALELSEQWSLRFPHGGDYLRTDPTPNRPHFVRDVEEIQHRWVSPWVGLP